MEWNILLFYIYINVFLPTLVTLFANSFLPHRLCPNMTNKSLIRVFVCDLSPKMKINNLRSFVFL